MDDPVQDRVLAIISRIVCTKKPIPLSTSINQSLRIDGDDAVELIEAIHKEFQTRFDGFEFYKYFHDEGAFVIFSFWSRREKKEDLTVQHLVDVVKKGTWFD